MSDGLKTADFEYHLPTTRIAQQPAHRRDGSRLLVLNRSTGTLSHRKFRDLPTLLRPGDVLVMNNSRVLPARLHGRKRNGGAAVELLLLEETKDRHWWAMIRPGRRLPPETEIDLHTPQGRPTSFFAKILEKNKEGHALLQFHGTENFTQHLGSIGEAPLPPYIRRPRSNNPADASRYQTIYATTPGSVAAPTAGLHFTSSLLRQLRRRGILTGTLTLHVGIGTFAPVKADHPSGHHMHTERFTLPAATAAIINQARRDHRRIIAVGTTTLRVLETLARQSPVFTSASGTTSLFLHPPADFLAVDALITNFHLPCSTLLMLAAAFTAPGVTHGRETLLDAYAQAVRKKYRFFSYGDAMFLA
ncbi:MAG: tRNA preQ1(34) S-adenosylmethionine ribosyltransferase-isomerase QueA [Verrucomicrobiota bacterium]|nr:tRNA preQ1(34) S-adenosylmethionine ribosyltransferase-isomerase QueA [Verrucomicrobiota bacterium]